MNDKRGRHWRIAGVAIGGATLLGATTAIALAQPVAPLAQHQPLAVAANSVPQIGVADTVDQPLRHLVEGPGTQSRQFCQDRAAWVRPHFAALTLKGADTVTVRGSGGDSQTLTADHGDNRALSTRSFPGSCVTIDANLSSKDSKVAMDSLQSGTAAADVIVAGAGDICGSNCTQTADLVAAINPAAVFLAGDNAYENGSLNDYRTRYDPAWGKFKSITHPSAGNHEYQTSGASGYFDYFNGVGVSNGPAGERGKGYYSWDIGDWHFVALNSNISMSAGNPQETWLRNDLRASTKPCTAAYWHHPRYNQGSHGNNTNTNPLWQALIDHKADLIVNGHDHNYQRFAPQNTNAGADPTNGIRQLVVGTGGRAFYDFASTRPNIEAANDDTYGVLKLALSSTGYNADFVPVAGRTFTDRFSGTCKAKGTTPTPSFTLAANPASVSVAPGGSATTTATVTSTGGFSAATNLTVSGLPSGVTASVSPSSVTPAANGSASATVTVSASGSAATGTSTVTVTGTSGSLSKTATFSLTVGTTTPPSTVFVDDFETSKGWVSDPDGADTATTGFWERGDPSSTTESGAKQLGTTTSGVNNLVTGRSAGSGAGSYDVDSGYTSMVSPGISLPAGPLSLSLRWSVGFGANATGDDYFTITVVGSTSKVVLDQRGTGAHINGSWRTLTADLSAFAGQTVRILVKAADESTSSLIEAQVDDVKITKA
ncbi:Alkaline phosphatase precursor (APASE) [Alloactinosynnema sp. L-07]|uniref:metallophosphoesterase n=1 Tax=Alloactinosynnema sp. L-07 TaxID=1653480 RepID=UPI00065F084D|nr:metallophosphoesterase [Alloactinosynnema sp. L-07]CRK62072.1 Alkaline phosphatase precursor (APASE) [Alloactinosynnema sp. L-07]